MIRFIGADSMEVKMPTFDSSPNMERGHDFHSHPIPRKELSGPAPEAELF